MKLNQYEWDPKTDKIGSGAFAEVFVAKDTKGDPVALKVYTEAVIKSSTSGSFKGKYTLENEFKKGRDLSHTNIIRYIGLDYLVHRDVMERETSYPVLIMEYADLGSLDNWLKSLSPPTEEESFKIITEIFKGLDYLHDQGIIHRDLKPGNILFKGDRKGQKVAKIADFGISRDVLEENINTVSTTTGVGTTGYMAPEQFLNKTFGLNGTISNRTDIWATGIIFYHLLIGKLPFGNEENKSYESLLEEVTQKEPDFSGVPVKFLPVLKGCLQKKAADRFVNAEAVLKALDAARSALPPVSGADNTVALPVADTEGTIILPVADLEGTIVSPKQPAAAPPPSPVVLNNLQKPIERKGQKKDLTTILVIIAAVVVVAIVVIYLVSSHHHKPAYNSSSDSDYTKVDTSMAKFPADTALSDTAKKDTSAKMTADTSKKMDLEKYSFYDDFSDNSNGWPTLADTGHEISVANGKLTLKVLSGEYSYAASKHLPVDIKSDFSVRITATWAGGIRNNGFGLNFGSDLSNGSYYTFIISESGEYFISRCENSGEWSDLKSWTPSSYINKNRVDNTLEVDRKGLYAFFYINNHLVEKLFINSLYGSDFGFRVFGAQTVDFDDMILKGART